MMEENKTKKKKRSGYNEDEENIKKINELTLKWCRRKQDDE